MGTLFFSSRAYAIQIIFLLNANHFHFMSKSEWFTICNICKIGVVLIVGPPHNEWKRKILS